MSEGRIGDWFTELSDFERDSLQDGALQDPTRIFNCDEIAVPQGQKSHAVLAPRGMVNVVQKLHGSDRKHTTVLITVQCARKLLPPRFLFPGKVLQRMEGYPNDCHYAVSPNGWMTAAWFEAFARETFVPFLERNQIRRPVVLFTDLHDSRFSLEVLEYFRQQSRAVRSRAQRNTRDAAAGPRRIPPGQGWLARAAG